MTPDFIRQEWHSDRLQEQVRRIAPHDTSILLSGETGTGKSRLARIIHDLSPRRTEPFLVVNCGALSGGLIESELFGHVRGAFTGAHCARAGKFADAGSGTLLLDEIDAIPLGLQSKLLRAVEDRLFEPVGSNRSQVAKARLIVASNRSLEQEVVDGKFRADLYYRLSVVEFHLPPLRERRSMIECLAKEFVVEFAERYRQEVHGIAESALQVLLEYDWPGNIRELRNVIERTIALGPSPTIEIDDLPKALTHADPLAETPLRRRAMPSFGQTPPSSLAQSKDRIEFVRIQGALHRHGNNRRRAAAELGISRVALYHKLHKYGLMHRGRHTCDRCRQNHSKNDAWMSDCLSAERPICELDADHGAA